MSRLRQSDFLRTPCPSTGNNLQPGTSRFFEGEDLADEPELNAAAAVAAPRRPKIRGRNIFAPTNPPTAPAGFTSTSITDNLAEPLVRARQSINYAGNAKRPVGLGAARRLSNQQNTRHVVKPTGAPPTKRSDLENIPPLLPPAHAPIASNHTTTHTAQEKVGMPKRGPIREAKSLAGGRLSSAGGEHKRAFGERKDANVAPVHNAPSTVKGKGGVDTLKKPIKPLGKILRKRSLGDEKNTEQQETVTKNTGSHGSLRLIKRTKRNSGDSARNSMDSQDGGELLNLPADVRRPTVAKRHSNPIIENNLLNPAMYESSWLAAQESSAQQLLNALFTSRLPSTADHFDRFGLRTQLLKIYSGQPFPIVYRRIQSSLLFGALAPAKDIVSRSSAGAPSTQLGQNGTKGWGEDLGLRRLFLNLFTETYDIELLSVALEVVIGREMFQSGSGDIQHEKETKKTVENYITKFIICCEDLMMMPPPAKVKDARIAKPVAQAAIGDDEDWGTVGWLWRKSVQRALMLILLLDKAKTERIVKSCLFQSTSEHKTSVSVVHHLSRLLLPSLGDIVRPLGHINYLVSHKQNPLEEFTYTVDNLAVDLRDGVRLVRAVELLLYPPTAESPNDWYNGDWPLSSHIKFPAIGRPQKIYNVSLALRALEEVGGNKGGVSAADVVDGYRERTVGLLLEMMQRWGLGTLVDFEETQKEVLRLERKVKKRYTAAESQEDSAEVELLKRWAAVVAELHGFKVENLTTSFADGNVFLAIVTEYEQYFPVRHVKGVEETLERKLRALGCNSFFAGLFGKHMKYMKYGQVFDKEFVIGALAYLCSRLLVASSKERAAVMIQRAYKAHYFRNMAHKRINLMLLAHHCAVYVNTRARVTEAAITIQRAFRKYIAEKIDRLIRFVTGTQASARGFLARRRLQETQKAAIFIQRTWRSIKKQRYITRMGIAKQSLTSFQAVSRGILIRQRLLSEISHIITLQRRWREISSHLRATRLERQQKSAASTITSAWLRYTHTRPDRSRFLLTRTYVTKLQSLVRGYQTRKNAPTIFRTLRKRLLRHTTSSTTSESIGAKTIKATTLARTDRGFARGILVLEKTTTWSNECCRIFANDPAAMKYLLAYLEGQCKGPLAVGGPNRTVGHAINVLTNLWRVLDERAKENIRPSMRKMLEGVKKGRGGWKAVGDKLAELV